MSRLGDGRGAERPRPPRLRRRRRLLATVGRLVGLAAGLSGCVRDVRLLAPPGGGAGGAGGGHNDGSLPGTACVGLGDAVRLTSAGTLTCAATLAARAHRFAVCSCSDWNATAAVYTDALSSTPSVIVDPNSAALGVNGNLTSTAGILARGSLYASGPSGVSSSALVQVGRSLRSAGSLALSAPMPSSVAADAYVGGNVSGPLSIGGTLHVTPTATVGSAISAAATTREAVSVPPPCDCSSSVDVAGAISAAMANNDNATIGLTTDRLAAVTAPLTLDVPCGVFALSGISAQAALTIRVHGRALLAVAGDIVLHAGLVVAFDPGAELDLMLGGGLTSTGAYPVGTPSGALFRIWVQGAGPIAFNGSPVAGAILHAPAAPLTAPAGLEMFGSIVAQSITVGGQLILHYDDAALSAGTECGDPVIDPVP
jgi:hypothetical protein